MSPSTDRTGAPITELNDGYSSPGAQPPAWSEVVDILTRSEMFWLSTVRRDGRPHVTPLPAIWLDGALHFCSSGPEQKTKNLERNPECILTTGSNTLHAGLDVVVEGVASRVTEPALLAQLAALWKSKLDWTFGVSDTGFVDPEGRQGLVFAVRPRKVLAFGKGANYTQTRYRFPT